MLQSCNDKKYHTKLISNNSKVKEVSWKQYLLILSRLSVDLEFIG